MEALTEIDAGGSSPAGVEVPQEAINNTVRLLKKYAAKSCTLFGIDQDWRYILYIFKRDLVNNQTSSDKTRIFVELIARCDDKISRMQADLEKLEDEMVALKKSLPAGEELLAYKIPKRSMVENRVLNLRQGLAQSIEAKKLKIEEQQAILVSQMIESMAEIRRFFNFQPNVLNSGGEDALQEHKKMMMSQQFHCISPEMSEWSFAKYGRVINERLGGLEVQNELQKFWFPVIQKCVTKMVETYDQGTMNRMQWVLTYLMINGTRDWCSDYAPAKEVLSLINGLINRKLAQYLSQELPKYDREELLEKLSDDLVKFDVWGHEMHIKKQIDKFVELTRNGLDIEWPEEILGFVDNFSGKRRANISLYAKICKPLMKSYVERYADLYPENIETYAYSKRIADLLKKLHIDHGFRIYDADDYDADEFVSDLYVLENSLNFERYLKAQSIHFVTNMRSKDKNAPEFKDLLKNYINNHPDLKKYLDTNPDVKERINNRLELIEQLIPAPQYEQSGVGTANIWFSHSDAESEPTDSHFMCSQDENGESEDERSKVNASEGEQSEVNWSALQERQRRHDKRESELKYNKYNELERIKFIYKYKNPQIMLEIISNPEYASLIQDHRTQIIAELSKEFQKQIKLPLDSMKRADRIDELCPIKKCLGDQFVHDLLEDISRNTLIRDDAYEGNSEIKSIGRAFVNRSSYQALCNVLTETISGFAAIYNPKQHQAKKMRGAYKSICVSSDNGATQMFIETMKYQIEAAKILSERALERPVNVGHGARDLAQAHDASAATQQSVIAISLESRRSRQEAERAQAEAMGHGAGRG